jgi:hypothetical protein
MFRSFLWGSRSATPESGIAERHLHKPSQRGKSLTVALLLAFCAKNRGDEEKKPEPPQIAVCVPLAVAPGTATKIILRGWHLDTATEVRSSQTGVTIKVLSKGAAAIPGKQDAKNIGDQQIEFEITTAASEAAQQKPIPLTVVTPAGESEPHSLLCGAKFPVVADNEPNDGFRNAQKIEFPQIVDGQIHADGNVDVFTFEVDKPTAVTIELKARSLGSGLDGILSLYDERGSIIANNDDHENSADSKIEISLTKGRYLVALQDAHDHGGTAHPYRLIVRGSGD